MRNPNFTSFLLATLGMLTLGSLYSSCIPEDLDCDLFLANYNKGDEQERRKIFEALGKESQVEFYLCAKYAVHPPMLEWTTVLADQCDEVTPLLLERLKKTRPEDNALYARDFLEVFVEMSRQCLLPEVEQKQILFTAEQVVTDFSDSDLYPQLVRLIGDLKKNLDVPLAETRGSSNEQ